MPGIIPDSKMPSRNRTPQACGRVFTKAVPSDDTPNNTVISGMNQPGPIHLHAMPDGSSARM